MGGSEIIHMVAAASPISAITRETECLGESEFVLLDEDIIV